jgi:hypothetical protein
MFWVRDHFGNLVNLGMATTIRAGQAESKITNGRFTPTYEVTAYIKGVGEHLPYVLLVRDNLDECTVFMGELLTQLQLPTADRL